MNDYTKGILTGASLILCFFILVSAKTQGKHLGDITVDSLVVLGENRKPIVALTGTDQGGLVGIISSAGISMGLFGINDLETGAYLRLNNSDENRTVRLGNNQSGAGQLRTYSADGKLTAYLGNHLETFNKHEETTGYFGTNKKSDGVGALYDRYGDIGWAASRKK